MTDTSYPLDRVIYLLTPGDLDPEVPAAEVVRADGSRRAVSAALLTAIDHLLDAVASDHSVQLRPLGRRDLFLNAAALTEMGPRRLRELIDEGRLPVTTSPAGDIVELADVVRLDNEFIALREQTLNAMWDEAQSLHQYYERDDERGSG